MTMAPIDTFRKCSTIDMWTLDRGCTSCVWATPFCGQRCYKLRDYRRFPAEMAGRDARNDHTWKVMTPELFGDFLSRRRDPVDRFRWCTRGEPCKDKTDVDRLSEVAKAFPNILFWTPTRAWHNSAMRTLISRKLRPINNMRVQASVDPSDSASDVRSIKRGGWSTMYFGLDGNDGRRGRQLCRKIWFKASGEKCSTCTLCFSADQTHVHMKDHA
jgi:hypothetical protein